MAGAPQAGAEGDSVLENSVEPVSLLKWINISLKQTENRSNTTVSLADSYVVYRIACSVLLCYSIYRAALSRATLLHMDIARPVFKSTIWKNGHGLWEMLTLTGPFQVKSSHGPGFRDPQLEIM